MSLLSSLRHTVVLGTILLGLGTMQQARAAVFIVTSTADTDGSTCGTDCTLRQAIKAVNKDADDTDVIAFDETVFASKQTIQLTSPLGSGPAADLPCIYGSVSIIGPTTLGSGLTISNNKAPGSETMRVGSPPDHVSKITIANLHITDAARGIANYGGDLTVTNCTFSNNAIGIVNWNMDWIFFEGMTRKIYQRIPPVLTVNNCTFAGNSIFGIDHYAGTTQINSCTVTGSDIGVSCGDGAVTVFNSLIVGNKTFNLCSYQEPQCKVTKIGQNITLGTAKEAGLDPQGLRDNGGPTPTIALMKGSVAINAGATDLSTDQRGKPRPQEELADLGAFEYDDKPLVPPSK